MCERNKQDSLGRKWSVLQLKGHAGFKASANWTGAPANAILQALICQSGVNRGSTLIPGDSSICSTLFALFIMKNLSLRHILSANTSGNLSSHDITRDCKGYCLWAKIKHLKNSGFESFVALTSFCQRVLVWCESLGHTIQRGHWNNNFNSKHLSEKWRMTRKCITGMQFYREVLNLQHPHMLHER